MELYVSKPMHEIEKVIDHVIEDKRGVFMKKASYRNSLREIMRIAGKDGVDQLKNWIIEQIETTNTLPRGIIVRRKGLEICENMEKDIPSDSFLRT
ncbi:MAG: hypothetical protein GWO20_16530 [Candidatus Korarchaeota archaeon]|nr:hypothetical protein [Candidatus Korarchaeota archaeon]NIU85011.1 hypothetical protein [Candidatus Thorarchaeota archaeon]NIW15036.1 hypothetical protein [Candidatus Thorarchaeota archaeon]NIW53046.1 hypothetical protein [Candidatus Korarchaeota archaeon]